VRTSTYITGGSSAIDLLDLVDGRECLEELYGCNGRGAQKMYLVVLTDKPTSSNDHIRSAILPLKDFVLQFPVVMSGAC